jgi:acyl carrier protein
MTDFQGSILSIVTTLLERSDKGEVAVALDTAIHGDGLGLDSLETAELSAMLEDEFGTDPFGAGLMPETIGEIVDFYTEGEASVPA